MAEKSESKIVLDAPAAQSPDPTAAEFDALMTPAIRKLMEIANDQSSLWKVGGFVALYLLSVTTMMFVESIHERRCIGHAKE